MFFLLLVICVPVISSFTHNIPENVRAIPSSSTSIKVTWKPPQIINETIIGYIVTVQNQRRNQQINLITIAEISTLEINIPKLEPNTLYSIQVAALTKEGEGEKSLPTLAQTTGKIPSRPYINPIEKIFIEDQKTVIVQLQWIEPSTTYGNLKGYRLRYGKKGQLLKEINLKSTSICDYWINKLEKDVEYEFRVAGINDTGVGEEAIRYVFL